MKANKIFILILIGLAILPVFYGVYSYYVVSDWEYRYGSAVGSFTGYESSSGASWLDYRTTDYDDLGGYANDGIANTGYVYVRLYDISFRVDTSDLWTISVRFGFTGVNWGWADSGVAVGLQLLYDNTVISSDMPGSGTSSYYITDGSMNDFTRTKTLVNTLATGLDYRLKAYAYVKVWGSWLFTGYTDCLSESSGYNIEFDYFLFTIAD